MGLGFETLYVVVPFLLWERTPKYFIGKAHFPILDFKQPFVLLSYYKVKLELMLKKWAQPFCFSFQMSFQKNECHVVLFADVTKSDVSSFDGATDATRSDDVGCQCRRRRCQESRSRNYISSLFKKEGEMNLSFKPVSRFIEQQSSDDCVSSVTT